VQDAMRDLRRCQTAKR